MKRQLFKLAVVSAVTGLALGTTAVAGASSISTTGPGSHNVVTTRNSARLNVDNHNDLHVTNNNPQNAYTGRTEVEHNTTGGDAVSGDAKNTSNLSVSATIKNQISDAWSKNAGSSNQTGSISNTGPDSCNKIEFSNHVSADIDNHNNVSITNNNTQSATSGNAEVEGNTTGGDAVSGDAVNTSNTTVSINITN